MGICGIVSLLSYTVLVVLLSIASPVFIAIRAKKEPLPVLARWAIACLAAILKIGEFSKPPRISVRMLRHYDEIGLLKPTEIDRFTDYRYYREDQLPTAGRIAALKDMGLSLADIVKILEIYDDREQLDRFFSDYTNSHFCPSGIVISVPSVRSNTSPVG